MDESALMGFREQLLAATNEEHVAVQAQEAIFADQEGGHGRVSWSYRNCSGLVYNNAADLQDAPTARPTQAGWARLASGS